IIAISYIFVSALAMFCYEPDTFDSFFDALYWATTALTTVGYGDVYPLTHVGQFISMASSLFGIAVIALPAGVITGGFMEEIANAKVEREVKQAEEERIIEQIAADAKIAEEKAAAEEAEREEKAEEKADREAANVDGKSLDTAGAGVSGNEQ
ncbi:MAG: potassium channel family protein, partial [Hydrogenoanaerobacterium sp.]